MITNEEILQNFTSRKTELAQSAEITLLGHSLFDFWRQDKNYPAMLNGKSFNNWGFAGITAKQYIEVILNANMIKQLGKDVFIFLGVNDIVKEPDYSPQKLVEWLNEILTKLQKIAPHSRYYLLEATPVRDRDTLENEPIIEQNNYIRSHLPKGITFIPTWQNFIDNSGKLDRTLTTDGLHFSEAGYQVLKKILLQYL
ncbi:lysophospholipase L1-like esterase [Cricetibacter osteomyelitidis]|uniref:Lysophospholipase L1-like esterase n=1 Tax=Cricetibacter osteomyelitidis TaxID=1521931 RepID=A0A4V2T1Z9_9PAST|nr:GDSL-type esterase/lipase family protein [Cricetibacter osteomyelitidis]TCP95513.1 lysophospholipase L1-like esterase [Cricetibacter osteomyelitidis]